MSCYFSAEQLIALDQRRNEVSESFRALRDQCISRRFKSDRAREYARHGFGRRLGTLVHAIDQVFEALPPEQVDVPERQETTNATVAIQSFVMNVFGCLDNLAWIWVYEKDLKTGDRRDLDPMSVGLGRRHKTIWNSFSDEFRQHLDQRQDWFEHLKGFRDSLAHRIPLYVPPYIVPVEKADEYNRLEQASGEALQRADVNEYDRLQSEQRKLVRFRPWMTHSLYEDAPTVIFHSQLLADYMTIDEFGRILLRELDR